jgi:diguanylate cyclase (GGDEF)-like protein
MKLLSSMPKAGPNSDILISNISLLQNKYITKGLFNIYFGLALVIAGITVFFISLIGKKQDRKLGFSLAIILVSLGILLIIVKTNFLMFFPKFENLILALYDLSLFILFPCISYFFRLIVIEKEHMFFNKFLAFQTFYSSLCIIFLLINTFNNYHFNYLYNLVSIPIIGFMFVIQLIFLFLIGLPLANQKNIHAKIFMTGFGLLSGGIIIDLSVYFLININQSFKIWRFGLSGFVISLIALFAKTYSEHKDRADSYELELKNISEKARLDYLTKLPNRLAIYEMFEKLSIQLESESLPLSVAIIDIDDFKHINDTYGHVAGDFILVELAQLTREILGPKGELGRWGGEEFLIIFPAINQSIAHHTSDNLRKQIANHKFEYQNHIINVTLSFGISTFVKGSTLIECVDSADQALYIAKSSGKNCVVSSSKAL